jgi:hypothetical protein
MRRIQGHRVGWATGALVAVLLVGLGPTASAAPSADSTTTQGVSAPDKGKTAGGGGKRSAPARKAASRSAARSKQPARRAPARKAASRKSAAPPPKAAPRKRSTPRRETAPRRPSSPRREAAPRKPSSPRHEATPRKPSSPRPGITPKRSPTPRWQSTPRRETPRRPYIPRREATPRKPSDTTRAPRGFDGEGTSPGRRVIINPTRPRPGRNPNPQSGPSGVEQGPVFRHRIGFGADDDGPGTQSIPHRLPGPDRGGPALTPRKRTGTEHLGGGLTPGHPNGPGDNGGPHGGGKRWGGGRHGWKGWNWWTRWSWWGGRCWWNDWRRWGRGYHRCYPWCDCRSWYWCWPTYRYWSWCSALWWPTRWTSTYSYSAYPATSGSAYLGATTYVPIVHEPDPCPWSLDQAWGLLAVGDDERALDAFDCLEGSLAEDGQPLIGYALAASALGEQEYAIAAMRDALRIDPASIAYLPDDERLRERVRELMAPYETRARTQYADVDALFMVAAMWYLVGEPQTADHALSVGITLGDADSSALNLRAMIESSLSPQ